MKIAIIIDSLAGGGSEKQAVTAAAELARGGQDVVLITYNERNDLEAFIKQKGFRHVNIHDRGPLRIGRVLKMAWYLRCEKVDVVHCFKSNSSVFGGLAAILARTPTIFGGYRQMMSDATILCLFNKWISRHATGWIVNSAWAKQTVIRDLGVKAEEVFVVPNAVDPESLETSLSKNEAKTQFGLPEDTPVVTTIAHLRPVKNYEMFLSVVRLIAQNNASVRFLSAGDGPLRPKMEALSLDMAIGGKLTFLGQCNSIPELLCATDVLVLTSFSEGLPNALVEAGCKGIPCISTDNGGAREIIVDGRSGYIVPLGDERAMADRVVQLLGDAKLRKAMGAYARELVSVKFSLDALAGNLLQAYRMTSGQERI